jgi:hypothetical protein
MVEMVVAPAVNTRAIHTVRLPVFFIDIGD